MKNFNRLFVGLLLAFGLMGIVSLSQGAVPRSPKEVYVLSYTTTISTVTPAISTFGVTTAAFQPGAVYQVTLSTQGANTLVVGSDFFQMYDSTGSVTTCGALPTGSTYLGSRVIFASATVTNVVFDPPLLFHNGLVVCNSSVQDQASITYELGRGLSGQ